MWKYLYLICLVCISAAAIPMNRGLDARISGMLSSSLLDQPEMPDFLFTMNLSHSDLISLMNEAIRPLSRNGNLTDENIIKLKDTIGYYWRQLRENFTADGNQNDRADTGKEYLKDILDKLKLKHGDFDYTIVRSLSNEINIEEEEEETNDSNAKDEIIVDYIKNIDKTIALEEGLELEPNYGQLKNLFKRITV